MLFLLAECVLCLAAVLTAVFLPDFGHIWFAKIEASLNRLAQHRRWAVVTVGAAALVLRAALLPVEPIPLPQNHDEFSYVLMADTFAHARMSNPPHPMWVHFETFHVNQQPRYGSMFHPAQGVFLAIGQVLLGDPFWGVWLSVGIMCAAMCWMFQSCLPPLWALLGGLLVGIRFSAFNYWSNSYWGGAVAAIGGALVLGSAFRIRRHWLARDALVLGIGLLLLANSRPYEGLFFSLPVIAALVVWGIKHQIPVRTWLHQLVMPMGVVVTLGAAAMLYYFWRTTGNPFLSPYFLNIRTYNPVPYFPWQALKPTPLYRHPEMAEFRVSWWLDQYDFARLHPFRLIVSKTTSLWVYFLGVGLTLPLLMAMILLPYGFTFGQLSRRTKFLVWVTLCTLAGLSLPSGLNVHYAAPLTGAIYLFVLFAMQRVRRSKWHGRETGLALVRFTIIICILLPGLRTSARILHIPDGVSILMGNLETPGRAEALSEFADRPGKILALVRYHVPREREQILFHDWLHNSADIDSSKIVWARDMGPDRNQELLDYFRGREVWLVEPDENPVRLSRYPAPESMSERTSAGTGGNAPEAGLQQAVRPSGH